MMFKIYDNKFIGYDEYHIEEEFTGSDTKELFYENLHSKPSDWYYRNANIYYKRNSWGHRCKDFRELDTDNYILSVGCSVTEGIGLELDKTYTHVLAEKLNCDYYNLGLGGFGIDGVMHNLIMWMSDMPHKPKLVILQWPYWGRFMHFQNQPSGTSISDNAVYPASVHSPSRSIRQFMTLGEDFNYFETVEMLAKLRIEHQFTYTYGVPLIHTGIRYGNRKAIEFTNPFVEFSRTDNARDDHFGVESHNTLATDLYKVAVEHYNL